MTRFIVQSSTLQGNCIIPSSKSHTLRAILFASLAKGKSTIFDYLDSPDAQSMCAACSLIGAHIEKYQDRLEIEGVDGKIAGASDIIHAGNSGIVLRFFSAIAALSSQPIVITGDHSIRHQRPMQPLLDALVQLKVHAISTRGNGFAPLIIHGPMKAGKVMISGEDSQPVSALLIAASLLEGTTDIIVKNAGERPWVDLTLHWLDRFHIDYKREGYGRFIVTGGCRYSAFNYRVVGDWSSGAFPIVAALITQSSITVQNLDVADPQGDKKIIEVLKKMGANIDIDAKNSSVTVKPSPGMTGGVIDINDMIDAITILAVVGCYVEGETKLVNAEIARQKECNRIACIVQELRKMGADISETADGLLIRRSLLTGTRVHSHGDQRMAMSLAVAGFGAQGTTYVESTECAAKTFPTFVSDFQRLGANIKIECERD